MTELSPWSDEGWVPGKVLKRSPCCGDAIWSSRADGVLVGSCAKCFSYVTRMNPKTGVVEVGEQEAGL